MIVMDAASGKVITSAPIGTGVDYAAFDPDAKLIFFSCADGTLNIFHEKSADEYEDAGAIKTQQSAKTAPSIRRRKRSSCRRRVRRDAATDPSKAADAHHQTGSFVSSWCRVNTFDPRSASVPSQWIVHKSRRGPGSQGATSEDTGVSERGATPERDARRELCREPL